LEQTRPVKLPSEPQPGQGKRILTAIVWPFKTVGQSATWVGAKVDEIQATLLGVAIVIVLPCIAMGALKLPQVQSAIKSVMEFPNRVLEPSNEK
jgi:hypothetical protein